MSDDPAVWNEDYQAQALKLANDIRRKRHANYAPSYQEKLLLADALMQAVASVEQLTAAMAYAVNLAQYVGEAKEQSILRAEATLFLKEYGSLAIPSTDGGSR